MTFNYSVQLNDPSGVGGANDAILSYDLQQALGVWSSYVTGKGTLVVALNIQATSEGRENGGPTSSAAAGTNAQGLNLFEPSSLYELTTGNHVSGTTSDITINIDPGYFQYLDFSPNLTYASQVASNKYNPIIVFLHEILHGFGQFGWYSQTGVLPGNYESTFDNFIQKTSSGTAFFTGPNAEAAYGGPVPLTTSSTAGENYYHFGNVVSDISRSPSTVQDPLTLDLENGVVLFFNYQYQISNLDLGVLKDLGYNVTTGNSTSGSLITALSVGQQMELIYIGYFNRAADPGGLTFWETQDANAQAKGQSAALALTNIANSFDPQTETIAIYPFLSNPSPDFSKATVQSGLNMFIENVYGNLFGHAADSGGLAFWADQITKGVVGLGAAVLAIANGAVGSDATILQNKITVASDFTSQAAAANLTTNSAYLAEAKQILTAIDGLSINDNSVVSAEAQTRTWIASQSHTASSTGLVGLTAIPLHQELT